VRVCKALLAAALDGLPDLAQVVLHPASLREVLGELPVRLAHDLQPVVDDEHVGAGGALIDCEEVAPLGHGGREGSGSPGRVCQGPAPARPAGPVADVQRTAAGPSVRSTNPVTSAATSSRFRSRGRMWALWSIRTYRTDGDFSSRRTRAA